MTIQRKIVGVITKMDETGVFHGDPNPANFMLRGSTMYMIDYGFAVGFQGLTGGCPQSSNLNRHFMAFALALAWGLRRRKRVLVLWHGSWHVRLV